MGRPRAGKRLELCYPRPAMASGARAGSSRVVFVDVLRLVASFQMVQGHTLDALLADAHRSGPIFDAWTWARGLTSVAFLFAAGLSFHLATLARLDAHLGDPAAIRRRLRRGAWLVLLGYLMHAPFAALGGDPHATAAALREASIVDVLQCIGVTLLFLEGLTLALRTPGRIVAAAAVTAVAAVALAPVAAELAPTGPLRPLWQYVTPRGGSIFPLLPWAGHMLAGVVAGAWVAPRGAATPRAVSVRRLLGLGLATMALGLTLDTFGAGIVKLGAVILGTGAAAAMCSRVRRLPRPLETLAGETLILYVSHVVVLYAAGVGLAHVIGRTVPLPQALATAAVAIVATAVVGLGWNRLKGSWAGRRAALAGRAQTG